MQSPLCLGNSVSALPWKVVGDKTVHPGRRAGLLSVNVDLQVGEATGVGQLLWGGRKAFWEILLQPLLGPEAALLLQPFEQSQPYFLPLLKVQWPQNEFMRTSYCSLGGPENKVYWQFYTWTSQALLSPKHLSPNLSLRADYPLSPNLAPLNHTLHFLGAWAN